MIFSFLKEKWSKLDRAEKANFVVKVFVKLTLALAIPFSVYEQNWMALFVSSLTLLLVFSPVLFERKYKIKLIPEFQIVIVLFIYAGIFLGEVRGYYTTFWWWDSILHAFSGVALGFAGFLILYIIYRTGGFRASFKLIAIFSFCFALALGALWEIFEFGVDTFFGANMQKARGLGLESNCNTRLGVVDTMWDLILDAIGALIASITGYYYLKNKKIPIFSSLIKRFEEKNPNLFKNKH